MAQSFVLVLKTLIYSIRTLFIIEMRIFDLNPFYVSVLISSVIRQKGKSRNGCFKKTKHVKFSEKRTFLTPWYVRVRIRGYEISVFRKIWRALFSWNTCFEIRCFALSSTTYSSEHTLNFSFQHFRWSKFSASVKQNCSSYVFIMLLQKTKINIWIK